MIISLRGTSGSGKSTLVRRITALYDGGGLPVYVDGRRRAYFTVHARAGRSLVVPGHYDIANGGIDTLGSLDEAYEIARQADSEGKDVLMEGKNMSDGPPHALNLWRLEGRDVRVVHILEPVAQCVASVRRRGHSISEETIQRTHEKCLRDVATFRCHGMPHVEQGPREQCFETVRRWLCA